MAAGAAVAALGLGALSLSARQPAGNRPPEAPAVAPPEVTAPDLAQGVADVPLAGAEVGDRADERAAALLRPLARPPAPSALGPEGAGSALDTASAAPPEMSAPLASLALPGTGTPPRSPAGEAQAPANAVVARPGAPRPGAPPGGEVAARADTRPVTPEAASQVVPDSAKSAPPDDAGSAAPEAPVPAASDPATPREPLEDAEVAAVVSPQPTQALDGAVPAVAVEAVPPPAPSSDGPPALARPGRAPEAEARDGRPGAEVARSAAPPTAETPPNGLGQGPGAADPQVATVSAQADPAPPTGAPMRLADPDEALTWKPAAASAAPPDLAEAARTPDIPPSDARRPGNVLRGSVAQDLPPAVPAGAAPPEPSARPAPATPASPGEPRRITLQGAGLPDPEVAVRVNRPGLAPANPAAPAPPTAEVIVPSAAPPADAPALLRFAAPFTPPADGRPLLATVLLDDGSVAAPAAAAAMAALPLPAGVALDPAASGATERMAAYRAQGIEVLAVARLPASAPSVDPAANVEAMLKALPEAVAVLELGEVGSAAVPALGRLAEEGLGAVLPAGTQGTAERTAAAGVPAAALLRDLDGAGQDAGAVRRFLDDAARRAGLAGEGVVLARVRPETLAALTAWAASRRAGEVALAPVSAVLRDAGAGDGAGARP